MPPSCRTLLNVENAEYEFEYVIAALQELKNLENGDEIDWNSIDCDRKDLFNSPERYPNAKLSDKKYNGSYHIYGVMSTTAL